MIKLNRDQIVSLGALFGLVCACLLLLEISFQARSQAAQELAERRALIARLEARIKARGDTGSLARGVAPSTATIDAPTQGLAAAQLQAYLAQIVGQQGAVLTSSGIEATKHEDAADVIRLQVSLDSGLNQLQGLLFRLESGTPYVFVESLTVQPASLTAPGNAAMANPASPSLLQVNVVLRALWRRSGA